MNKFRFYQRWVLLAAVCLMLAACGIAGGSDTSSQATIQAMSLQNTALALQITQQAQNLQMTPIPDVDTGNPPPLPPQGTTLDELRRGARILLFEDIAKNPSGLERYVKRALDDAGYTYFDVQGDEQQLKDQIFGNVEWDLIIISSESSGHIPGDYFEYLTNHLQRGVALIVEMWDMDDILYGKISTVPKIKWLLDTCGVELQADWYNPENRQLWLLQSQHPLLNEPNTVSKLENVGIIWRGDIGDLMKIKRVNNQIVGDATFLVGLTPANTALNGMLTTCMGGRVVLQTFDSHEYTRDEVVKLWQNYVYQTLTNHFMSIVR
ncbi:MAG: hypothetical protein ACOY16_01505 [Chloroflexota bacterium]